MVKAGVNEFWWRDMGHFFCLCECLPGRVCMHGCVHVCKMCFHACVWTHSVSAVQFLQKGVVRAFGEATLLIDKSQHAQFLKTETDKKSREGETHGGHDGTSYNPIGAYLEAFIRTMHPGNSIVSHSLLFNL